jgi:hypothetical protein
MKALCLIALTTILSVFAMAQQAQPDRWKGLVLDETTPQAATELLGQPKDATPQKIRIEKIGDWLGKDIKQELPHMRWENIHGMRTVDAYFLDGKLVALNLTLKTEVRAAALESIYGVEFKHLISNAGRKMAGPGAYQRDKGETFSNQEEVSYHVGAKAERAYLVARCEVAFGEGIKRAYGAGTDSTRAGKVRTLQIYSRRVENRDGADALSSEPATAPLSSSPTPKQATPTPSPAAIVRPSPTPVGQQTATKKPCYFGGKEIPCNQ